MCSLQTLQESLQEEEYCGFAGADTHTACMDGEYSVCKVLGLLQVR